MLLPLAYIHYRIISSYFRLTFPDLTLNSSRRFKMQVYCSDTVGDASWFDCSPGTGACSTCDSSQVGCAYPYVTGFPGNYAAACHCNVLQLPCGTVLHLANYCTVSDGTRLDVPIVDHGPNARLICSNLEYPPCAQGPGFVYVGTRLIDLTRAAFVQLGGNLADGIMPVHILNQIWCSPCS